MLYKHKIIVGSYTGINREIALDLIIESEEDEEKFKRVIKKISLDIKRDVKVYEVETLDTSWKSVVEKEEMFDGVLFIEKQEEFLNLLKEPNYLSSLDIANFVLTWRECTHEELERLVYLIYLEYYSEYNEKLFNDNIFII